MDALVPLDRLLVTVIVDNESDGLSPPCACCDPAAAASARAAQYTSEVSALVAQVKGGGAPDLDFRAVCNAGHGYSLLLEAEAGGVWHRLLFDGGPSCDLFRRNAATLSVPLGDVDAAVLSHWHIDHSVGLIAAAEGVSSARAGDSTSQDAGAGGAAEGGQARPPAVFDLHPRRPHRRGLQLPHGVIPLNPEPELAAMQLPGIELQLHDEEHTLLGGTFYVSGHIPRVTDYERGNPNHASQWEPGGPWQLDEEIADERYVAVDVRGRGAVVFSACSHAGIVNVMRDVAAKTGQAPYAVFGGFHLAPKDTADRIDATVADMAALQPALVVAGHCTGWRAKAALAAALGERFMPSFVGSRFSITALPGRCLAPTDAAGSAAAAR